MQNAKIVALTTKEVELLQSVLFIFVSGIQKQGGKTEELEEALMAISDKLEPETDCWDKPLDKYVDMGYRFPGSPKR